MFVDGSPNPRPSDVMNTYHAIPGLAHVGTHCWEWHGLAHRPVAAWPRASKPWQRHVELLARYTQVGVESQIRLFWHIIPAKKHAIPDGRTKHWILVLYSGHDP